ncbi:MAG: DUF1934 domain-containing protein [Tepidibacter sp.]|jgi:uncharacterized beta-barrel protein YwiB (DUF1934 family)|uniref:DUF1934 domain-containing protein n=1 Tax=Tepidibacter sp. TaxID=2529387 RepID=UPI0025F8DCBD|nr:DUF1934 domain-containing protein [Tepidibacter sp.]MCT4508981.1 DUF1934 domain-containing protein [Tepidibacter sp.]
MGENVLIKINTIQMNFKGNKDNIELITEGKLYLKNNCTYVIYEESEISGMKGTTSRLKISKDCIIIKKMGRNNSELVFELGKRFKTLYRTPHGSFPMEIVTKKIQINNIDSYRDIDITIEYDLNITGLFEGKNSINIQIN